MVGVPRSKGCRICVQRRVKCDQTRPICNNCKKGNRPCPGYGQDLKFQDESVRLRKRFANGDTQSNTADHDHVDSPPDLVDARNSVSPPESEESSKNGTDRNWDFVGLDVNKTQRKAFTGLLEGKRDQWLVLNDFAPDATIEFNFNLGSAQSKGFPTEWDYADFPDDSNVFVPRHLSSPNVNQNQLLSVFKDSLFPQAQGVNGLPAAMRYHSRWLAHLPPLTGTNNLLDTAVRAVTLVHIGRLNTSELFLNESRPYYGKALRLLNTALLDDTKGMSNETLCATILLSFYEMFASDNNESWIRHAGGAGALMRMRGAARHRYGFDREIFLAYRYTLLIESFQQDVPCFLNEPEWRKLSEDIHSDIRTIGVDNPEIFELSEVYYKALLALPEVTAEARNVWNLQQAGNSATSEYKADLTRRILDSRTELRRAFQDFEAALKKTGHAPTFSVSKDPVVSISYDFVNVFVSSIYTGFWTCSSVLNLCLLGLQSDQHDLVQVYHTENRDHALNICRSTPYMLTSSFLGPFFVIFGLRIALCVYQDSPGPECDWILQKLFEIGDRHMGMAKHVPGFQPGMSAQDLILEFRKTRDLKQDAAEDGNPAWLREIQGGTLPNFSDELLTVLSVEGMDE